MKFMLLFLRTEIMEEHGTETFSLPIGTTNFTPNF